MKQYKLSPLWPHREKEFALIFRHPVYSPHPISKWPTRPPSHPLYPGYKSELRTPVHHWFSLELACSSNSISHSNKLYLPLILSHVWKFFSNPCPDHARHDSLQLHGLYSPWNSRGQNAGVGSPFPSPGDLPNPGIKLRSPALQADSLPAEPQRKPRYGWGKK